MSRKRFAGTAGLIVTIVAKSPLRVGFHVNGPDCKSGTKLDPHVFDRHDQFVPLYILMTARHGDATTAAGPACDQAINLARPHAIIVDAQFLNFPLYKIAHRCQAALQCHRRSAPPRRASPRYGCGDRVPTASRPSRSARGTSPESTGRRPARHAYFENTSA